MTSLDDMCPRFAPVLRALTWVVGRGKRLIRAGFGKGTSSTRAATAMESMRLPAAGGTLCREEHSFPLGPRLSAVIVLTLFSICALADSGADIYKAHCSACHAINGAGDTMLGKNLKLRSLSSPEVQQQSDEQLFSITSNGKNRMPAYGRKLTRQQIEAVVKHIRELRK
jgi:cytochrome c5